MGYCAALNCLNASSGVYKNSSVSFYGFPLQNKPLLRQWIQNMGRDMETPSKYQCLCSEHFEESSFRVDPPKIRRKRRLLKEEAVPSKFILGVDGTWLVGTPQGVGDVRSKNSRKRIRDSEPCRVPGMFPRWPRLEDWQNEFYKQLLKEKYGSVITLGKDCAVPKSHVPAGGAAQVKEPQDLEERKIPASLNKGRGGAMTQSAGSSHQHGSSPGTSRAPHRRCSDRAGTSGSGRHPPPNPAANAADPAGTWSGSSVLAGWELDEFRQFLLDHQGRPEEAAVPWFICAECGKSFPRHASLLRHRRAHAGQRPAARRNPRSRASPRATSSASPDHKPAQAAAVQAIATNPALPGGGVLWIRVDLGDKAVFPN